LSLPTSPGFGRMTRTALTGPRTPGSPGFMAGRPKETVENVTALDDPLDVASMSREQRDALKRELLRRHPHLAEELTDVIRSVD
jgi:hypothetical protein